MKDFLVEFTENGAIVHKDPSIIASKKDLPFCFLNPNLSKISGISPSYWAYNNGEIVPVSAEEKKRRDEHHQEKLPEPSVSLKTILDEFDNKMVEKLEKVHSVAKNLNNQLLVYKIALAISLILSLIGVFK